VPIADTGSMGPGSRRADAQLVRDMRRTHAPNPPRPFGALVPVCRTLETSGFGAASPRRERGANGASAARGAGNKSAKKSTVQRHAVAPRAVDFGQRNS